MARSAERKNPRMKQWNYSSEGWYFVTICVKNRAHVFGNVRKGKMRFNKWGKIAHECWQQIPIHFPGVEIDQFVIMPNHVHGIVVLRDDFRRNKACLVPINRREMKLSTIIGSFKSVTTKKINSNIQNDIFAWQRSFHDHIIRSERELINIQNYIFFNPDNWRDDDFFVQSP